MGSKTIYTGFRMQLPLTDAQEKAIREIDHELDVQIALAQVLPPDCVFDMDSRRLRETQDLAYDIARVRVAALQNICVEEEARKLKL